MGNLENRLSRLEKQAGMSSIPTHLVWFVNFVDPQNPHRELLGVKIRDETILRPMEESEEGFIKRLEAEQLERLKVEHAQQHCAVVMLAIRSKEVSKNAKP